MLKFTNNYAKKFPLLYKQLKFPDVINNIIMDYIAYNCFKYEQIIKFYPTKITSTTYNYLFENNTDMMLMHIQRNNVSLKKMLIAAYLCSNPYIYIQEIESRINVKYPDQLYRALYENDKVDLFRKLPEKQYHNTLLYLNNGYLWKDIPGFVFECAVKRHLQTHEIELCQDEIIVPTFDVIMNNLEEAIENLHLLWPTRDEKTIELIRKYQTTTTICYSHINKIAVFDIIYEKHIQKAEFSSYIYVEAMICNNRELMVHIMEHSDEFDDEICDVYFKELVCGKFNECFDLAMEYGFPTSDIMLNKAAFINELDFVMRYYEEGTMREMLINAISSDSIDVFEFLISKIENISLSLIKTICFEVEDCYDITNYIIENGWHHLYGLPNLSDDDCLRIVDIPLIKKRDIIKVRPIVR